MSEKSVILLEDISSLEADTVSVLKATVSSLPLVSLEEKVVGERERERERERESAEETPMGGPE